MNPVPLVRDNRAPLAKSRVCAFNDFPQELLLLVFGEATVETPQRAAWCIDRFEEEEAIRTLVTITHVCKHWRNIALDTASLWTRISGNHRGRKAAFLERSRSLPLSFFVREPATRADGVVSVLKAYASRLQRLDLAIYSTSISMPQVLNVLAPMLECLTICDYAYVHRPEGGHDPVILNQEVSFLRALALQPVSSWVPRNHFTRMTHLSLSFTDITVFNQSRAILEILSRTPLLRFLQIGNLASSLPTSSQYSSEPVALVHLQSLSFVDSLVIPAFSLLKHVDLGEKTMVRLQGMRVLEYIDDPLLSLPTLSPLKQATRLELAASGVQLHMVAEGATSGVWIGAVVNNDRVTDGWDQWLVRLPTTSLALENITSFMLYYDNLETSLHDVFPHLLQCMSRLVELQIKIISYDEYFPEDKFALTTRLCDTLSEESDMGSPVGSAVCPHLEFLDLQMDVIGLPERHAEAIADMLRARSELGCPVRRLTVQEACLELETLVEDYEFRNGGRKMWRFEPRANWFVDGEEDYWELSDEEKPAYDLPFVVK
ncbi:hypothetical protein L226DRAFT_538386 [Lentinus tigrinus ALCF2SS1-7]|uniref:F-box domain-containing protein n=1 Tax=Lentinus tigrinus ALCF2SS1-6 TaxID=1328759 RepID=A0A5C2RYU4_9APHY|nr:hypothetical protein L227DRAFT_578954 [Lentinus tigrinus ALCF2SS1-6]RPD71008.1 hypothetical protein L226DRAFT_538386 [Lentinus tigrinus ALCF2SS1-7]